MSDPDQRYDRQGGEPPLTMARDRRGRGRGPAPVTLIVSILLLVVVAGAVAFMYRSGARNAGDGPQPLGTPLGDIRAPAPPSAQAVDPGAGLTIARDDPNAASVAPTLAAPPEQPLPQERPAAAAPAATPPPPPPPQEDALPRHAPPGHADQKAESIDGLIARSEQPKAAAPKAETAKAATPKPVKATPAAGEAAAVVQIGAFSSEVLADQEWSKAASEAPGAMAGKGKRVVPINKDGQTLYRTSITGFASREQAVELCDRLTAAGGHCFVH